MASDDSRMVEEDDRLMRQFAGGDESAFETLYRRYEAPVYGFCARYLGDLDRAADAFQETWIRLIDARDRFEPRGRFRSWLFTLAHRACADQLRDARRTDQLAAVSAASARAAAEASPSKHEIAVTSRDEVTWLLGALPSDQREILLLARYHGFTYAEIAEMTDSTEAAVKQKAYRAIKAVRRRGRTDAPADAKGGST